MRPGGLEDKPATEVGRLIVSGEDTLFGLDNEPSRVISRDTVSQHWGSLGLWGARGCLCFFWESGRGSVSEYEKMRTDSARTCGSR